ncbi:hypothetical protein SPLC1_S082690 [Arthrospira platensis C1]|nr:hypothetical protein SPLC1_S082690 [Arthrospira platensis C1]
MGRCGKHKVSQQIVIASLSPCQSSGFLIASHLLTTISLLSAFSVTLGTIQE